ncbi:methyl-accepting chemotaxis protein [Vibrio alginolyticus]
MSIKQSIAALVILLSVSFSAFAEFVVVGAQTKPTDFFIGIQGKSAPTKDQLMQDILDMGCFATKHADGDVDAYSFYGDRMNYRYCKTGIKSYASLIIQGFSCPDGEEWNPDTEQCESPKNHCEKLMENEPTLGVWWNEQAYGRDMLGNFWCASASNCTAQLTTFVGCDSGNCFADAHYTGDECEHGTLSGFCSDITCSAQLPEPEQPDPDNPDPDNPDPDNPDPDNPDPDNPDVTDPTHDPEDPTGGDIEDPSVLPDDSTNTVDPGTTEDEPDVEDPPTDESTDTAVVSAITGMNKDVNKALNAMNIDINQASADVQNQIIALNASVVTNTQAIQKQQANDNEIYRKTKSLIQQANADITTAVNKNTNAINGVGNDVEQIAGAMDGIAEDVAGISETLDGIANTDTSGAGTGGTCIEAGNCTGFYESAYPDGLGGLVSGQLNDLKTNVIDDFVNSFGNIDLSNAQRPSFVLPVPFYGDFSFEEHISFDWVFGFVRAVLIISSIFAARRIIFGG